MATQTPTHTWVWTAVSPLLPGAAHSVAIIAVGHPFDTVKTRLQLGLQSDMMQCAWQTWQNQGISGFYRGAAMPLCQLIIKRPFEFAVWEWFNSKFSGKVYAPILGGCLAGLTSSAIGNPFSVVKIQLQATGKEEVFNVREAARSVWLSRGMFGFYRGFTISLYKEVPFAGVYLGTYGNLREALPKTKWSPAVAGAIASMLTWSVLLPLDTLKTVIQFRVLQDSKPLTVWQQLNTLIRDRGMSGLWAGWAPVAIRSLPSSAAAMMAYEWARSLTREVEKP